MPSEQPLGNPNLVAQEQSKAKADRSGGYRQRLIQTRKMPQRIGEGKSDRCGNQHHPDDGSDPKNEQVADGPSGATDGRENK